MLKDPNEEIKDYSQLRVEKQNKYLEGKKDHGKTLNSN